MEEKKVYGPKPSYKFMKSCFKEENRTGFYCHGMNLVYYCIKHDFNEEQVNEYLDKEIQKCTKYLNSHNPLIFHSIPYHIYKDIINTSKDDFKLYVNRNHKYDYANHKYTDEIEEYNWYEWINRSIPYTSDDNRYKTLFRQCSEHSIALDNLFKRRGYCSCEIQLKKQYNKNENPDTVFVVFNHNSCIGNKNDFKRNCLNYWHFIKLLDCISEEDKNDIDIDELYSKKEVIDKLNDITKINCTKKYRKKKESIIKRLINKLVSKL